MAILKCECSSCNGTGVYSGFTQPPGVAVVCVTCRGTGEMLIHWKPFKGRKLKRGVNAVRCSDGTSAGVASSEITYADFRMGVMPKKS
jgi:hypothetical protein